MYWASVQKEEAELRVRFPEGFCTIISEENVQRNSRAGAICEVTLRQAAEHLLAGTARLLTAAEAESYQREQSAIRARNHRDELQRVKEQFESVTKGML